MPERAKVVIIGAGFGGLWAAEVLAKGPVEVMLVDRNNYHTFFPLAYQVAAAELSPEETVNPVRSILRKFRNVRFTLAQVERIDLEKNVLVCSDQKIPFDYLVLAAGSTPHYFGIPGAAEYALPLRTLEEALALRNRILQHVEAASCESDPAARRPMLTFTVVGGGPTGVEFVGALAELIQGPLRKDFPNMDFSQVRVILLEAMDSVLPGMPERLQRYTRERLARKGIEVQTGAAVSEVTPDTVYLKDGQQIPTQTVVWTAGHRGHPLAEASGLPTNRRGQVQVLQTLQVEGYPSIYAVGDLAGLQQNDKPVPMVAPAAIQGGKQAAKNILRQIAGEAPEPLSFRDPGMMVVIGRNAAVVSTRRLSLTGFPAWVAWLGVHLFKLIGFRNRLQVLIKWGWDYLFFERAVRLILPAAAAKPSPGEPAPKSEEMVTTRR